ncbi:MAG: sulfotransferase, partial [Rhizobiaceae bacterium]
LKLIFLTGHRKSGTTLLHKLYDGHPQLCVYPVDAGLFYAYFPAFTSDPDIDDGKLVERACNVICKSFSQVDAGIDEAEFADLFRERLGSCNLRNKSEVLKALIGSWQNFVDADPDLPVLIKETSQVIYFNEFQSAFPEIRMVNLLRDPRDNYSALKAGVQKYYSKLGEGDFETLASLINRARMDFRAGLHNASIAPTAFCNLRFEDLTANPKKSMERLASFVGITFDECLLEPTMLGRSFSGNNLDGEKFEGVSAANTSRWRERISPEEAMIIEYWLDAEMKAAGYDAAYSMDECQEAFGAFYAWYNTRYFFNDAFADKNLRKP